MFIFGCLPFGSNIDFYSKDQASLGLTLKPDRGECSHPSGPGVRLQACTIIAVLFLFYGFFEIVFHVAQAGPELLFFLLLSPKFWEACMTTPDMCLVGLF